MFKKIFKYFSLLAAKGSLLLGSFRTNYPSRLASLEELLRITEERSRSIEHQVVLFGELLRVTEERSRSIEHQVVLFGELLRVTEERSRSIEYRANEMLLSIQYHIDLTMKSRGDDFKKLSENKSGNCGKLLTKDIYIGTNYPLAVQSNDHVNPQSTMEGMVRPTRFVMHCIDKLGDDIRVLDVGVGAAGAIFEFLANNVLAVGIDGSDYCKKCRVGYWPFIENNLFTADITKPFGLFFEKSNDALLFDLITAWECLEHIAEDDLPAVLRNVVNSIKDNGYFIGSISMLPYVDDNGVPYHLTLKPKSWWKQVFLSSDLEFCDDHIFDERLFCRGNGPTFQDFHNYINSPSDGFHFVARKNSQKK